MARSCANCMFSYVETRQSRDENNEVVDIRELECRKGPPVAAGHPKYMFPIVNEKIWCFEYLPLIEDVPDWMKELNEVDAEFSKDK